jgi:hypothetical protein
VVFALCTARPFPEAQSMRVRVDLPLRVRLVAPGFEIRGDDTRSLVVVPNGDSLPVVFYVRPTLAGDHRVWLHVEQAGNPIASLPVAIHVGADAATDSEPLRTMTPVSLAPALPAPDSILYVHHYRRDGSVFLHLLWTDRSGQIGAPADIEIRQEPQQFADSLYAELLALHERRDPVGDTAATRTGIDERLRDLGHALWEKVLPDNVRRHCWAQRSALEGTSLMVCTDEPYIPWELVWPWDDAGGSGVADGPWCVSFDLARWYVSTGGDHVGWRPKLPLEVATLLRPSDASLVHAVAEEQEIRALIEARRGRIVGPPRASHDAVREFLARDTFDWMHVASHGLRVESGTSSAVLVLENGETLAPSAVAGRIASNIRHLQPAFVFNACDSGGASFVLTGIGGWAERLIRNGAGLFLGTLWPVDDRQAKELCIALYRALLSGVPVGTALRGARRALRKPGEITWLAYTLYAHPNAVVVCPGEPRTEDD